MRAILAQRGETNTSHERPIRKHLIQRFVTCHPEVATQFSSTLNRERAIASNPQIINHFFNRLSELRSRYHIQPQNMWNFDEKGFLLGVASKEKVLCRAGRRNPHVIQEGSHEWITLIECISAGGETFPPCLIYKGEAHYMGWHDYEECREAMFDISPTGWSNNRLGLHWLKEHFHPITLPSRSSEYRLIHFDGYSSH